MKKSLNIKSSLLTGWILVGQLVCAGGGYLSAEECLVMTDTCLISKEAFEDKLRQYRQGQDMVQVLETLTADGKRRLLDELIREKRYALSARQGRLDEIPAVKRSIQAATDGILAEAAKRQAIQRIDLSDSALLRYYKANPAQFKTIGRVKARHIQTKTRPDALAALKDLHSGRGFAAVAAEVNIDATRTNGGDLGWVRRGVMVRPFEDALFGLEPGQFSEIVKTNFGYHIILAEQVEVGQPMAFETVKNQIKQELIDRHLKNFSQGLEHIYPVKIDQNLLDRTGK